MREVLVAGLLLWGLIAGLTTPIAAIAQGKSVLTDRATGLVVKVVAASNKIEASSKPDGKAKAFTLELLEPYYVIEEAGAYYKITSVPALTVEEAEKGNVGYVKQDQVHKWPTREALHYTPLLSADREPVKGWGDEKRVRNFLATGDKPSYGHSFEEDLSSSAKRERGLRPYPVLGSFKTPLMKTSREKRVYNVLLPATVMPGAVAEVTEVAGKKPVSKEQLRVIDKVTFGVVFDATGSMEKYARPIADEINGAIAQLGKDVFKDVRVGFVYFRDREDREKSLILPPIGVAEAAANLKAINAYGGGDAAEPVLDALYLAVDHFDWDAGDTQSGAKKIIIAVLNSDAHPKTTGLIDPRVPANMSPADIAQKLLDKQIVAITVQAGPEEGPNLKSTLRTVADGTAGEFISWTDMTGLANTIGTAVKNRMTAKIVEDKKKVEQIIESAVVEGDKLVVPLKVLDGEMRDRLKRAGVAFNIDDKVGGILVTNGYIVENDEILEPQIRVEKPPLQDLLGLYSALSIAAPDCKDLVDAVQKAIGTMAGERINPKDRIDEIIKKKTGLTFRTDLLAFDTDWFCGMTPPERLKLQKRIKEASDRLGTFLEANTKEFDLKGSIWMQVGMLP